MPNKNRQKGSHFTTPAPICGGACTQAPDTMHQPQQASETPIAFHATTVSMAELSGSRASQAEPLHTKSVSMSTIESSVTRLLVSTKHLLESLTQWARQEADNKFVSDAYVKLGNDYRAAARAFNNAGVDMADLGDVPKALRIVLESALSEAPTQKNLDRFLPNIRNIIVTLLLNLKAKQNRAREIASENKAPASEPRPELRLEAKPRPSSGRKTRLLTENLLKSQAELQDVVPAMDPARLSDALTKLQKGNVILRRASKRFSAYQYAKLSNYGNGQSPRVPAEFASASSRETDEKPPAPVPDVPEAPQGNASSPSHLFLRMGDRTKKVDVQLPITMAALRLLFVEKFAYSPGSSSFPDILVVDPRTSVSYELEDHLIDSDVRSGTLVSLKHVEAVEKVEAVAKDVGDDLSLKLDDAVSKIMSHVTDAVSTIKIELPATTSDQVPTLAADNRNTAIQAVLKEMQKNMLAIKQAHNAKSEALKNQIASLSAEVAALKSTALEENSSASNRSYMEESYSKLSEESDSLLTKVDDLQDMMEALRKDVAQRGVRLGPKQLKATHNDINDAKKQLLSLSDYIREGKPTWKKVWEAELDKVCEEQQFFNLQDDLTRDLDEDIRKIEETFDLIEKCSLEQSKQSGRRNVFAVSLPEPGESMQNVRDAVLDQVSSLVPDHESRLDAIARAEKSRQREKELLSWTQFQEELGDFVDENKFKTSGGIEELEKRRQQKDIENLKSSFGIV